MMKMSLPEDLRRRLGMGDSSTHVWLRYTPLNGRVRILYSMGYTFVIGINSSPVVIIQYRPPYMKTF